MNNLWQRPVPEQSDARETVPGRSAAAQEPHTLRRQDNLTSRQELMEGAQRLRADGLKLREIAARMGLTKEHVWKLVNPERTLEHAAKYRNTNRDRRRASQRHYGDLNRAPCSECGQPRGSGTGYTKSDGLCQGCHLRKAEERRETIVRLWHEGAPIKEIAAAIGSTKNATNVQIVHMRQAGYDLPYRYAVKGGKRTAA